MRVIPTIRFGASRPETNSDTTESGAETTSDWRSPDLARHWIAQGFTTLHVSWLDAEVQHAEHRDQLREIMREIMRETSPAARIYVSGGVRDAEQVAALLDLGAEAVVVDQLGRDASHWLHEQAELYPGQLIPSVELEDRHLTSTGWATAARHSLDDFLSEHGHAPFGGLVVRAVRRRGKVWTVDLPAIEDLLDASPWPVVVSAGAATLMELRTFEECGVTAVLVDAAPEATALDARILAEEFAR